VSLDNLISYVKTIRPQAGALENLSGAVNNYIGTEHILLGILHADDDTGQRLAGHGLTAGRAERALADLFARIQADRRNAG